MTRKIDKEIKMDFETLFSPIDLGPFTLRNRIVMPALGTNFANGNGEATTRLIDHYKARAAGGAGMIIVEGSSVHFSGRGFPLQFNIDHDDLLPRLGELTDAVHDNGARILIQLHHGGRTASSRVSGVQPIAPSAVKGPVGVETPRAMTVAEIEEMVEKYTAAAIRAQKAGFDGIEIHGTHEYLVHQFMSSYSNFRRDRYGGSLKKRLRFALQIVKRIREETGSDFLISFRMSGEDHIPKGMHLKESVVAAKELVNAGVDVLDVSGGVYETPHMIISPMPLEPGVHVEQAALIKEQVNVPVIGVGRINSPDFAEKILKQGKVDLVATGRAFIADAEWPLKAREGRLEEIRRCIGCNQGCIDYMMAGRPITCLYNPSVGKDSEFAPVKTSSPKKVVIVGGGPGGLEAARSLGEMGHEVLLFDKGGRLGGQVPYIGMLPSKQEFYQLITFYENEIKRLGVKVSREKNLDRESIVNLNPDAVVISTGSITMTPDIPGLDNPNVVTVHQILKHDAPVGRNVVVLGGGNTGCEVADYLSERGHKVSIMEMSNKIAADIGPARRYLLLRRLRESGVRHFLLCRIKAIHSDRVLYIRQTADGHRSLKELTNIDTFVNSLGLRSLDALQNELEGSVERIFVIGDALHPGKILDAVAEGAEAARMIENGETPVH